LSPPCAAPPLSLATGPTSALQPETTIANDKITAFLAT
jgi:hypothetical protein